MAPRHGPTASALPLSAIGGFQVYDTSVPGPQFAGHTRLPGAPHRYPPTTAHGIVAPPHSRSGINHVIVIGDNTVPAILSATSNVATANGPHTNAPERR